MNKEEVLKHLGMGKTIHLEWMQKAKRLLKGGESSDKLAPIESETCPFYRWFLTDGQRLSKLSNNPLTCMQNIEKLHGEIHTIYNEMFKLCAPSTNKEGLLGKLFSAKPKVLTAEELEIAQTKLLELERVSNELIGEIERLERRLGAVSDEKIASLE
ncbi:MAG: CZB domain-containing protein [Campylobacterales bacterium]|nr:CZB domain-containing protein [Campylobacterales bacterium]